MIPAFPKTYVVEIDGSASDGFTREPIVAWAEDPDTPLASPIPLTMQGQRRILNSDGILLPCGMVVVPMHDITFSDTDEWLAGAGKLGKRPAADTTKHAKPESTSSEESEEVPEEAPEGGSPYDIQWAKDSFKSNSWWHYDDGEYEFVFQIDGGEPHPKATEKCAKIKRTDFTELKKTVDVLTVDEINEADPLPQSDDDEDDGDDLI